MQQLLGLNLYLCVVTILAVVAIYTVIGKNLSRVMRKPTFYICENKRRRSASQ